MYLYLIVWPHHKLSYQLLSNFPNIFMVTKIRFGTQLLIYLKGWAQLKPPNTSLKITTSVDLLGFNLSLHLFCLVLYFVIFLAWRYFAPLMLFFSDSPPPPPHSLRVFVPLQRKRHSWTTASPHRSPPEQTAENNPCIPATATAAYRLWAGKHAGSISMAGTSNWKKQKKTKLYRKYEKQGYCFCTYCS